MVIAVVACGHSVDAPSDTTSMGKDTTTVVTPSLVPSSVYDTLGSYSVVTLGAPPIAGTVVAKGINDSDVVVGYIMDPPSGASRSLHGFEWRNGNYRILAGAGVTTSVAAAINARGDILGLISPTSHIFDFAYAPDSSDVVVWAAGQAGPKIVRPRDSIPTNSYPFGINANGAVGLGGDGTTMVVDPTAHTVSTLSGPGMTLMNARGDMAGTYNSELYPAAVVVRHDTGSRCVWGYHGVSSVNAINDSGDVVGKLPDTAGHLGSVLVGRTSNGCSMYTLTPGFTPKPEGVDFDLRAINNRRWIAGSIWGYQGVMILGVTGFAGLDSVLRASGTASAAWQVTKVLKLTNRGTFLVQANGPGVTGATVLLVPAKPH